MKKILLTVLLVLSIAGSNAQNKNEMENKTIETLITAYAAAVDTKNTAAAEKFLDAEFRVVLNNYNNNGTTTILTKNQYLGMIKDGRAGGSKRSVSFLLTDIHENAAIVKVKLEGDKAVFTNYYSLIKRDNQWLIVNDIPQLISKPQN
ncbi:MAG: nuclear transport factor 2 family protein [Chitinophagales bacterium]|nr:nuclear transport factor 2 family protein [Chitinophagales bacterium]